MNPKKITLNLHFNFNIAQKSKRNSSYKKQDYKLLKRNVKGIIHIDKSGTLFVNINNTPVYILKKCYTKSKSKYRFYQKLVGNKQRFTVAKNKELDNLEYNDLWYPFGVGCTVVGNLLLDLHGTTLFNVRKVLIEYNNNEAKLAMDFWRNNYEEIEYNKKNNL